jgi:hypothetical protein
VRNARLPANGRHSALARNKGWRFGVLTGFAPNRLLEDGTQFVKAGPGAQRSCQVNLGVGEQARVHMPVGG